MQTDTLLALDAPPADPVAAPAAPEPQPQPTPRKPRPKPLTPSEPTPPALPPLPEMPPAAWKFFQLQAEVLSDRHHGPLGGRGVACALGSFGSATWSAVHEAGRAYIEAQYREACRGLVAPPPPPLGTGGMFSAAENARSVRKANAVSVVMDAVLPASNAAERELMAREAAAVAELERVAGPLLAELFLRGAREVTQRTTFSVDILSRELINEGAIR